MRVVLCSILAMASSTGTQLECHDQALLQCILNELKLKGACCSSQYSSKYSSPATQSQFLSPGRCPMEEETRSPSAASATLSPRSLRSFSPAASCRSSPHPQPAPQPPVPLTLSELLPPACGACPSLSDAPATETSAVSWRVMNPNAKFKASCGFPLVSQQLSTPLLDDFRVRLDCGFDPESTACRNCAHLISCKCTYRPSSWKLRIFAPGSAWATSQSKGGKKKEMASNKA